MSLHSRAAAGSTTGSAAGTADGVHGGRPIDAGGGVVVAHQGRGVLIVE